MRCQWIQTTKIADENKAEREMLAFLQNLPERYFVYRELQLAAAYQERMRGTEKKKPDFVVVSQQTGLISIEVKDWDLINNTYTWQDQYKIQKVSHNGQTEEIPNPTLQIDAYLHAFIELLSGMNIFVTSLLAFPRLTRASFLNRLQNVAALQNPQSRFYLDLKRVVFHEDIDQYIAQPEKLLLHLVQQDSRYRVSSPQEIERVHRKLLPPAFCVGDFTQRQAHQEKLKMLTEQQQKWIFSLDRRENYLLDVAGSGKTNALISKAIHLVDQAKNGALPNILLTTYNHNLETNIRRIFKHKITTASDPAKYQRAIHIYCVPALLEKMIADVLGSDNITDYLSSDESPQAYEDHLRAEVEGILRSEPERFRQYDYVFIDEIQDFDDFYLQVIAHLCKSQNFFFVGDIGQKIYARSHNLARLGLVVERIELKKSYKMFRTPRYIAELATRFILGDSVCRREFEEYGYTEDFRYPNNLQNIAEIIRADHPEEEIANHIKTFLSAAYSQEDIMVIAAERQLDSVGAALQAAGINYTLGESEYGHAVTVVNFMNVKGLEKEVVFIAGIEDLYNRAKPEMIFADEGEKYQEEVFSRRKIYVSLTRSLEQLIVYYRDASNPFIAHLLTINRDITNRRQG